MKAAQRKERGTGSLLFHLFLAFHCLFLSRRAIATECLPSCRGNVAAWLLPPLNPLPHCLTTFLLLSCS